MSVFGMIAIAAFLFDKYRKDSVVARGRITNAYVTKVSMHIKPTLPSISYYYVVKEDTFFYNYNVTEGAKFSKLKELEGKTLKVMYDSINVNKNILLINEKEYR